MSDRISQSDQIFGPYLRIFFSGITQRPVLQEKGPPWGLGSYKTPPPNSTFSPIRGEPHLEEREEKSPMRTRAPIALETLADLVQLSAGAMILAQIQTIRL